MANRKEIESIFQAISDSNNCIQQMLPNDKKEDMNNIVSILISDILSELDFVSYEIIPCRSRSSRRAWRCWGRRTRGWE